MKGLTTMQKKKIFTYLLILFIGASNLFSVPIINPHTCYPVVSNEAVPYNDVLPEKNN